MPHNFIIAKFGGTSVADYIAMNNSADIVLANPAIRLVVLSASAGVTNQLFILATGKNKKDRRELLDKIICIQYSIIKRIYNQEFIRSKINYILEKIKYLSEAAEFIKSAALTDELISCGELMSSLLFVEVLRQRQIVVEWFDVRQVMRTDDCFGCAKPDICILLELVKYRLRPRFLEMLIVTQGFIGKDVKGRTTTLGRGGSDYTAAILGEALQVKRIDIWTDVPGIYTTDPHLVPSAKRINELTFSEAAAMAIFGAKVLHPGTLVPAVRSNISIFIGSSKNPTAGGTIISDKTYHLPVFRAITLRRKQIFFTLYKKKKLSINFLETVLKILMRYNISLEVISFSEMSLSFMLDMTYSSIQFTRIMSPELLTELSLFSQLEVEENLSLVTIIGNFFSDTKDRSKKMFHLLDYVSLHMFCDRYNQFILCFLVRDNHAEQIVKILHHKIFE
ncbi:Lysine-sensitive aspartokinase 3 [Candidatus Erwinia haradaeae]|uniref:Aspartokinase n=1 Tax=Candidatus Erwinia haradaeae TaxID=1922217 RepID=A0A451D1L0_9GAMM|nr:Lysine-sensitive aspartokinase 3 [Candidatus Erwinia haradaeae]